ncbi:hypothetical protein GRZ55_22670 [Chelativorans sp. ZYF759]|uniref:hypothetical protein n=1 Tax=Chelativorans sp. ZYF759 TaxID=2692213 RepID=UPI00145F1FF4|nr:hypothetical protein [Chelativorans sp. ZYF759]NMG42032.1 hypothetical protein [Chelativorans sp. ZYF759]
MSGKVRFAARVVGKDVEDGEVVPVNLQRRPEQCLGFSFCDDEAGGGQQGCQFGAFTWSSFELDVSWRDRNTSPSGPLRDSISR